MALSPEGSINLGPEAAITSVADTANVAAVAVRQTAEVSNEPDFTGNLTQNEETRSDDEFFNS